MDEHVSEETSTAPPAAQGPGPSATPRWIAALVVTAVVAAGAAWFVTDRSNADDLGEPTSASSTTTDTGADADAAEPDPAASPSWLFSMTASGATFAANELNPNIGTLTLTGTDSLVTGFTDRPVRDTVSLEPDGLVSAWPTLFADSDPNAVLVTRSADGTPSSYVLELSSPSIDGSSVTFQVGVVVGEDHSSQIPGMTAVTPVPPPATMGAVSLFIDDVRGPGQTWVCIGSDGTPINPPAPIPYDGNVQSTASTQFEAQCVAKKGKPAIVGAEY